MIMNLFNKNKKQLNAIFSWLSGIVDQNDLILVEWNEKHESYYFKFPLKLGDNPEKIKDNKENQYSFFINFSSRRVDFKTKEWKLIFQLPELEVWENKKRFDSKQFKPLRWGLNEEEKKEALKIARESIGIFLRENRIPQVNDFNFPLAAVFNLKTDLDVALWVSGALRGSFVVENTILKEGIIQASVFACRDSRFKPLGFEELEGARIEITLFSDLRIPLSKGLIDKNEIFYNKGYLLKRGLSAQAGGKRGWFLPEVFNVLPFKNLKEFLFRLGAEKTFLRPEEIFDKRAEFFIFEVDDFIESANHETVLNLDGPLIGSIKQNEMMEKSALLTADWLLKMQENDGNFIPIINPLTGKCSQIDWPRSIFTGWSLIEFGKATGNQRYVEAGHKNFLYGKKYLLEERIIKNSESECLNLSYLGQEALSLDYPPEARQCGNMILEKDIFLKFEPILFSQIGSFFAELSKTDKNFFAPALRFGEKARLAFANNLRRKQPMNLAVWAELANLYLKLFEIQNSDSHLQMAREVIDWLLGYQLENGSFKAANSSDSNFAYTRGTAKIAEVLTGIFILEKQIDGNFDTAYYRSCFEKAFNWLKTMQFSFENSYFIPKKNLDSAIGGFRHDYFNQEIWIDSSGHFLLAFNRFFKRLDL